MIIVGVDQLLAGLMLTLNGVYFLNHDYPITGVVELVFGLWTTWNAIQRQDPPHDLLRV